MAKSVGIWRDGYTLGACDMGFGPAHRLAQAMVLDRMFITPLPESAEIVRFDCSGFQDIEIRADITIEPDDADPFLAMLIDMYQGPAANIHVGTLDKRHVTTEGPDGRQDRFVLPPADFLHMMTVTVTRSTDATKPWRVAFAGGQF